MNVLTMKFIPFCSAAHVKKYFHEVYRKLFYICTFKCFLMFAESVYAVYMYMTK